MLCIHGTSHGPVSVCLSVMYNTKFDICAKNRFNGPFSGTTRVSRYQKGKTNLDFFVKQETVSGSGISWAICKSAPRSRQITTSAPHHSVFTARCYASAVLAMGLCLSVSVCDHLSQAGVLLKRQNVGSRKQHRTIAQGLSFSDAKDLREIRPGSPPTGAPNADGVGQNRRLSTNNWLYLENGTR